MTQARLNYLMIIKIYVTNWTWSVLVMSTYLGMTQEGVHLLLFSNLLHYVYVMVQYNYLRNYL